MSKLKSFFEKFPPISIHTSVPIYRMSKKIKFVNYFENTENIND